MQFVVSPKVKTVAGRNRPLSVKVQLSAKINPNKIQLQVLCENKIVS